MRRKKEGDRSVEVANPDFGGACVEVESAFLLDLRGGIRGQEDLDANFRLNLV
jgi:hypothetical protein